MKRLILVNLTGVAVMVLACAAILWLFSIAPTPFQQGQCIGSLIACAVCLGVWLTLLYQAWERLP